MIEYQMICSKMSAENSRFLGFPKKQRKSHSMQKLLQKSTLSYSLNLPINIDLSVGRFIVYN